ncbi:MAG: glycoside hydrolase family 130 protein [Clostridia bacterium]|nr:glycoside hydrolase family 130 protein [Clostridia bacterium]
MANAELKSCPAITRYENNPVLKAEQVPYDATLVFNAGVIKYKGKYVMVFRNDYNWIRRGTFEGTNIGICHSDDGIHWEVDPKPCFDVKHDKELEAKFHLPAGEIKRCYDPRLTVIEGEVYMCFAVDTKHGLHGGIAKTTDFKDWEILSLTVPDNRNMVLFPEKVNGRYVRLERPMPVYSRGRDRFDLWMSQSPDMIFWGCSSLVVAVEDFNYTNDKVGPGAPPIKTDKGWLVFTHGVDLDPERGKNGWEDTWKKRYCAGMVLLDLEDPSKVLGIYRDPLLAPETDYERTEGFRTNVIFPTAAVAEDDGTVKIYYGAADTVIAMATANIDELVELCLAGGPRG